MGIFDIDYTKPTYKKYKDDPEQDFETIDSLSASDKKLADSLYERSGNSEDMDGDIEDPDELEMSNMGEEPLSEGFLDGLIRKIGDADFEGLGKSGSSTPKSLGKSSGNIDASDPTRGSSNSFSPVANPYTAGLPKYSQSSGNY